MKGFLIINKPTSITSFDVIRSVRNKLKEKKVGHVGTLDPFASGVLIVALDRFNKLFFLFDELDKEYIATGVFGESRDTDDIEGKTLEISNIENKLSKEELENIIKKNFLGEIEQKPPIYSAKKINGERAYKLARQNKTVELKSVKVNINSIELLEYNYPYFTIKVSVSKGTYIRSIIRDIGIITNNLAYTKDLKRTAIGEFTINNSISIDKIFEENILSFFDMFNKIKKEVVEDKSDIRQILCGNTKLIEHYNFDDKHIALVDNSNNLLALITKNNKNENVFSFVNS